MGLDGGALLVGGGPALVLDEGLDLLAVGQSQDHLGGRTEEDQPLDHGRHPVGAGRLVGFDPDPLGSDGQLDGAGAVGRPPLGGQVELPEVDPAGAGRTRAVGPGVHQVRDAQEVGHVGVGRLLVDVDRGAHLGHLARLHDGQPVGHGEGLLLIVGHVEEGDPHRLLQRLELDLQGAAQLGVEGAQGLVEQQDGRVEHQGAGQGHPLLLTAGQLTRPPLLVPEELDEFEGGADPPGRLGLVQLLVPEAEGHVVGHAEEREEGVALEHRVHVPPVGWRVGHVGAVEVDAAAGGLFEPRHQAKGGGLPASRGPEDGEELARGDVKIDTRHRLHVVEALGQ